MVLVSKDGVTAFELPSDIDPQTGVDRALEAAKAKGYNQYHNVEKGNEKHTIVDTDLRAALDKGYRIAGTIEDAKPTEDKSIWQKTKEGVSGLASDIKQGLEKSVTLSTGQGPTERERAEAFLGGVQKAIPTSEAAVSGLQTIASNLAEGRVATPEQIQAGAEQAGQSIEEATSKAPLYGQIGEIGTGAALPLPGGEAVGMAAKQIARESPVLQGISKATEEVGSKLENVGGKLRKSAERGAVGLAKPSAKQLDKLNKSNPELGRRLIDEGMITTTGLDKDKLENALKASHEQLNNLYTQAQEATQGQFLPRDVIISSLEKRKEALSNTTSLGRAARKELDEHINELKQLGAEGVDFLSPREVQENKSLFQKVAYGVDRSPEAKTASGLAKAKAAKDTADVYKELLDEKMTNLLGDDFLKVNKDSSDYIAAKNIIKSKKDPEIFTSSDYLGGVISAGAVGPGGMAAPIITKTARTALPPAVVKTQESLGKLAEKTGAGIKGLPEIAQERAAALAKPAQIAAIGQIEPSPVESELDISPETKALLEQVDRENQDNPKKALLLKQMILKYKR